MTIRRQKAAVVVNMHFVCAYIRISGGKRRAKCIFCNAGEGDHGGEQWKLLDGHFTLYRQLPLLPVFHEALSAPVLFSFLSKHLILSCFL